MTLTDLRVLDPHAPVRLSGEAEMRASQFRQGTVARCGLVRLYPQIIEAEEAAALVDHDASVLALLEPA